MISVFVAPTTTASAQTVLPTQTIIGDLWWTFRPYGADTLQPIIDQMNFPDLVALKTDLTIATAADLGITKVVLFETFVDECLARIQPRLEELYYLRVLISPYWSVYRGTGGSGLKALLNGLNIDQLYELKEALIRAVPYDLGIANVNLYSQFRINCLSRVQQQINNLLGVEEPEGPYQVPYGEAVDAFPRPGLWPVYESTNFAGKPNLYAQGFKPIKIVGESRILDGQSTPNREHIQSLAMLLPTDRPVCLDIESWPTDPVNLDVTIRKLTDVARWIRLANPAVKFGFYAIPPLRVYWQAVSYRMAIAPGSNITGDRLQKYIAAYQQWQQTNERLMALDPYIDYCFPSLYTFYDDREGWLIYAEENIAAAQRHGKPIIPFLRPAYHGSNPTLGNQPVGSDYWRLQVNKIRSLPTDGVVVWMGSSGLIRWEDWRWWYDVIIQEGLVVP